MPRAQFISVGDRVTVTANRGGTDFDAAAIRNEAGHPACEPAAAETPSGGETIGGETVTEEEAQAIARWRSWVRAP